MSNKRSNQKAKSYHVVSIVKTWTLGILVSVLVIVVAGSASTKWRVFRPVDLSPPTATTLLPLNLSKEYIYAGDRLIATEEPANNSNPLLAPANLAATTISREQIRVTWDVPEGGADHYEIERSQSVAGPYIRLMPDPVTNVFDDTNVSSGTAYLYHVRAVNKAGNISPESNLDLATAITFEDDPLIGFADDPTGANVTPIRAQHLIDLRRVVDAVRATAGLPAVAWSDGAQPGAPIKAAHIQELRRNLDQALDALRLTTSAYTDPTLSSSVSVKATHIKELRQRVK